jgi:hypothetical protein
MNDTANDTALKAWLESEGFPAADSLHEMLGARIANATTPLMHAARAGNAGHLAELLAHGADGFTALELAANRACMKVLRAADRQAA